MIICFKDDAIFELFNWILVGKEKRRWSIKGIYDIMFVFEKLRVCFGRLDLYRGGKI